MIVSRSVEKVSRARLLIEVTAIAVSVLIGFTIVVARDQILPERFSRDAQLVQDLADGASSFSGESSFVRLARVYSFFGVDENPTLAGVFTFGVYVCVTILAVIRLHRISTHRVDITLLAVCTLLLGSVFLGTYSKEIVTIAIVATILLLPRGVLSELAIIIAMMSYGLLLRQYWILIACTYVVFRIILTKLRSRRQLFLLSLIMLITLGVIVYLTSGVSADYFRIVVNSSSTRIGTETMITKFVFGQEPLSGIVNVVITWFALLVPWPLFLKLTMYHSAISLLLFVFTVSGARGMSWVKHERSVHSYVLARVTAALVALSLVQALFEPDYGSYLRHLIAVLPLLLVLAIRVPSSVADTAEINASARSVTPTRHGA